MNTTVTDEIPSSWLVSFGKLNPPPDSRRLAAVEIQEIKKPRKPSQSGKNKMTVKSREGKKLRRGIFALLRKGIEDQIQVYDFLVHRGFIKKREAGRRGSGISKNEFLRYLSQAMVHLRIPKKTIGYLAIKSHKEGKGIDEIAKELSTRRSYIRLILTNAGLIEKLPKKVAKITPPAWSKRGIK